MSSHSKGFLWLKNTSTSKKISFKKNRKASEHVQRVCKDARDVMKIMTLNQKNLGV